jgi:hypothetical protein
MHSWKKFFEANGAASRLPQGKKAGKAERPPQTGGRSDWN